MFFGWRERKEVEEEEEEEEERRRRRRENKKKKKKKRRRRRRRRRRRGARGGGGGKDRSIDRKPLILKKMDLSRSRANLIKFLLSIIIIKKNQHTKIHYTALNVYNKRKKIIRKTERKKKENEFCCGERQQLGS
jgi:hypothetical protein